MNNKFRKIEAIFFDTADTLYHNPTMEAAYPDKLTGLLMVARHITHDEAEALLKATTQKLKATTKHVTKVRAMAELGFSRAQVHEQICKVDPREFLVADPKLEVMMRRLSQNYSLGIISNFKRTHILEILSALGLPAALFPLLVTEDIVTEIKPDHEPFLKAIELSGYEANRCLYVGDSPTKDMQPAKEVGMSTVLVGAEIPVEQAQSIDALIPDIKQITDLLALA